MQALRHYLLAVQFFTRIPVTGRLAAWVGYSPDMLRASAAHFPALAGWLGFVMRRVCLAAPRVGGSSRWHPWWLRCCARWPRC